MIDVLSASAAAGLLHAALRFNNVTDRSGADGEAPRHPCGCARMVGLLPSPHTPGRLFSVAQLTEHRVAMRYSTHPPSHAAVHPSAARSAHSVNQVQKDKMLLPAPNMVA